MASVRQVHANRSNATHSTGPYTSEGKATSRINACDHGLSGNGIVLPGELELAFHHLLESCARLISSPKTARKTSSSSRSRCTPP